MYILTKNNKYVADDTDFPARVSLTTNKNNACIVKEYREAEWIASVLDMEVLHHGKEKEEKM